MRLVNAGFRGFAREADWRKRSCQRLCAALLALAVGSCLSSNVKDAGVIGSAEGFAGAAVASFFALAVTLPSPTGLGAGVLRGRALDDALAAKRIHYSGAPDTVSYEDGTGEAVVAGLSQCGHAVEPSGPLDRVSALWRPEGLSSHAESCQARSDPRASGLSVIQAD